MRSGIYWDEEEIRKGYKEVVHVLLHHQRLSISEGQRLMQKHDVFANNFYEDVVQGAMSSSLNGFPADMGEAAMNKGFEDAALSAWSTFLATHSDEYDDIADDAQWEADQVWREHLIRVIVPYALVPGCDPVTGDPVAPVIDASNIIESYNRFVQEWADGYEDDPDSAWMIADALGGLDLYNLFSLYIALDAEDFDVEADGERLAQVIGHELIGHGLIVLNNYGIESACRSLSDRICEELVAPSIDEINSWR